MADDNSQMPCHAHTHAALCHGFEKSLSDRHNRGMARAQHGRSIDVARTRNGRGMDAAWARHGRGMDAAWTRHGRAMDAAWTRHGRGMDAAWTRHGRGMACVNKTQSHCVNQMGKTLNT
jgi:hypothetical protein